MPYANWSGQSSGSGGGGAPAYDPTTAMLTIADDFVGGSREASTADVLGQFSWASQAQNAGTFSSVGSIITSGANHPGVLQIGSGANSNDAGSIYLGRQGGSEIAKVFVLGSGAIRMRCLANLPTLSNGTDNATLVFGLADNVDWSSPANTVKISISIRNR